MKHQNFYLMKVLKISLLGLLVLASLATKQQATASPLPAPNFAPPVIIQQVSSSEDDVMQGASGLMNLSGSILTMGDTEGESQFVGLRFSSVTVPPGSHIVQAWLSFTALGDSPGVTTLTIAGHAADHSPAFTSGDGPMDRQSEYTSATVDWNPMLWADGMGYNSPDIASIIQEIVGRQDWYAGNAISLFILDDGVVNNVKRDAVSWDLNPSLAPVLTIAYEEPLEVDPEQILAQGEFVLNPPPGLTSSSWLYPVDYRVEEFSLYREFELISLGLEPADYDLDWYQPYLRYQLSIGNNGEPLSEEQAEWAASQTVVRNLEGTITSVGSEDKIYYYQMDNAAPMCSPYGLLAFIPNGLSGDTNPGNDWGVGTIEDVGSFDRDIRFTADGPSVRYWGPGSCAVGLWNTILGGGVVCGDFDSGTPGNPAPDSSTYLRIKTESEALGSCPPLLSDTEAFYFYPVGWIEPEPDRYHVMVQVYRNGDVVTPWELLPPGVNPAISLSEELENNDVICVDIALDPQFAGRDHGYILETNESNNRIVQLYSWNTNFWHGNEFYFWAEDIEPPYPTCVDVSQDLAGFIEENSTKSYLTAGPLAGILILGFIGGTVGRFLGGRSTGMAIKIVLVTGGLVGGAILGGLIGYIGGSALTPIPSDLPAFNVDQPSEIQPAAQPLVDLSNLIDQGETCEAYFKTYAETLTNQAGELEDIHIIIAVPSGVTLPGDSRFQVTLWDNNGLPRQFATNDTVISLADAGFFPDQVSNPLVWQIGLEVLAGPGGDLFLPQCLPDGLHTFKFEGLEDTQVRGTPVTPTPTYTPTPIQPAPTKAQPTATTPPKAVDTKGPKVSGASASPNPALTTSPVTISATISDSSGVAKVTVYYKTGKGGYQSAGNMKSGGGNSYFLNIGALTPAGTYTFRILAEDKLGNTNCSTGNLDACPGGTFVVNIP